MSGNGKKRKEPEERGKEAQTSAPSRRDKQREVAERRAAHFARAEPGQNSAKVASKIHPFQKGQISSTPTGSLRRGIPALPDGSEDDGEGNKEQEAWPGPFSTALAIMAKRDAAKKAREEAIAAQAANTGSPIPVDTSTFDEYDKAVYELVWPPINDVNSSNRMGNSHRLVIPSLSTLCASMIAKNFTHVEDVGVLPVAERESVAVELAKLRQCDPTAALKLAVEASQCLVLPECSEIDEECLVRAIEQVAGVAASRQPDSEATDELHEEIEDSASAEPVIGKGKGRGKGRKAKDASDLSASATAPPATGKKKGGVKAALSVANEMVLEEPSSDAIPELAVLRLRNCGRGMTDRTAAVCINLAQGGGRPGHGLEQLQLVGCYRLNDTALCGLLTSCKESLISLDLSCNSRLSGVALSCVRSMLSLQELVLDNCTQLVDEDILKLIPVVDSNGNGGSSSSSSRNPMSCPPLTSLSLGGLIEITDDGVVPLLQRYGSGLSSLHLSGCVKLTDHTIQCIRQYCGNLRSIALGQLGEVSTTALLGLFVVHPTALRIGTATRVSPLISCQPHEMHGSEWNGEDTYQVVPARIGYLEEIRLAGTVSVTDDVIVQLCESNKRTIRTLDVNGCYQLTTRAAMALLKHSSASLHTLDLSFVRGVSQEALGALIDAGVAMDCLRTVTVWGCTQLADKFWAGIRKDGAVEVIGRMAAQL